MCMYVKIILGRKQGMCEEAKGTMASSVNRGQAAYIHIGLRFLR